MKLIQVLKTIINEAIFVDRFDVDNETVTILKTFESIRSTESSNRSGRVSSEDILDSMSDIYDIIIDQSNIVLDICKKDCSLLIRDYRLGFDYQLFIKRNKSGLVITINTSMKHPMSLRNKKQKTREIIISKNENIRIKEDRESNNFTKIVKGNIIVYIL